jgi:hypothetical protein
MTHFVPIGNPVPQARAGAQPAFQFTIAQMTRS